MCPLQGPMTMATASPLHRVLAQALHTLQVETIALRSLNPKGHARSSSSRIRFLETRHISQ